MQVIVKAWFSAPHEIEARTSSEFSFTKIPSSTFQQSSFLCHTPKDV